MGGVVIGGTTTAMRLPQPLELLGLMLEDCTYPVGKRQVGNMTGAVGGGVRQSLSRDTTSVTAWTLP
jgi:hypothetical protein